MSEIGAKRRAEIKREIQDIFPQTEWDLLKAQINWVFEQYEKESLISRDTHPNRKQMIGAIEGIQRRIESVMARFCEDDGAAIMGWLSGVMDDPEKKGIESSHTSFVDKVTELHKTTVMALDELYEHDEEFELNGTPHKRKTQTSVRDGMVIPMLTVVACRNGLAPSSDWGHLDDACRFVDLVLEYAEIPAPDAGKNVAKRGEAAQGRLRRMIKESARKYRETGKIDK